MVSESQRREERVFKCESCIPRRHFVEVVSHKDIELVKCPLKGCNGPVREITEEFKTNLKTLRETREQKELELAKKEQDA